MGEIIQCDIICDFLKANIFPPVRARVKASLFTFQNFPKSNDDSTFLARTAFIWIFESFLEITFVAKRVKIYIQG